MADALSFMPGRVETMHEAQGGVMGLLRVLDFALPWRCPMTGLLHST